MKTRSLSLNQETLTDLTTAELGSIVAAEATPSCPLVIRLSELLECHR